jgi:hypothetical protein
MPLGSKGALLGQDASAFPQFRMDTDTAQAPRRQSRRNRDTTGDLLLADQNVASGIQKGKGWL